ncbi:hypothetical protein QA802_41200 [Streptomyces sp. B21-105]|uniref:hypothetical protein n=1 Tax=Streptomyces sp. B21-105 TaxID=3039417 RepID=UPI002FF2F468
MKDELSPYEQAERRAVAKRAAAILQQQIDGLTATADDVEQATGIRIVRRRPHILDARRRDLEALRTQAQAWLLAMALIDRLLPPGDTRTLGDAFKTMPPNDLRVLRRALRQAGALHDGGEPR